MRPIHRRLLPAFLFLPIVAHGTIVTTAVDEDNGSLGGATGVSLREAVKYSAAGATVTFAPALSGKTIRLLLGEIFIANPLTIDGSALATRITISGDKTGNGRTLDDTNVFRVGTGAIVLDSLIISGGYKTNQGGGIISDTDTANLTVNRCHFAENYAQVVGGAIFFSKSSGTGIPVLTLSNSTFSGNSAAREGGAIYAIYPIQIQSTTFTGNTAQTGGAIFLQAGSGPTSVFQDIFFNVNSASAFGGAIYLSRGSILLERSIVSGNSAVFDGGGIYSQGIAILLKSSTVSGNIAKGSGGGIYTYSGYTDLENSTIAMNTANSHGGGIFFRNTLSAVNCTIATNTAGISGGGLAEGGAFLKATIVCGNSAPSSPDTLLRQVDGDGNLITPILSLAPLGNYGGPTQTMPPLTGSPAIDPTASASSLTVDQRGYYRVNQRDIGAVEYRSADSSIIYPLLPSIWNTDADGDGFPYGIERFHGTDPFYPDASDTANLGPPAIDAHGLSVLSFSVGPDTEIPGTQANWRLLRSLDLSPGSFKEIYRYGSLGEVSIPGVTFYHSPEVNDGNKERVTVIDANRTEGSAFYRLEAVLQSLEGSP